MQRIQINGAAPNVEQLYRAARINYGHFTSMQVRERAVRGLDLHLERLISATRELFGTELDAGSVRSLINRALAGQSHASVRVTVFAGAAPGAPLGATVPDILVAVTDPVDDTPQPAWTLQTTRYVRDFAHLKHVSTMGLIARWREAVAAGCDDALFVDERDAVSEGSAWNLALWDGKDVVWPQAAQLSGITMQLLHAALPRIGVNSTHRTVYRSELDAFAGALAAYSHCPAQPVSRIDALPFAASGEARRIVAEAWDAVAWTPL